MDRFDPLVRLKEKVRLQGQKLTKQREVICQVFFEQKGHQSAEAILVAVRRKDNGVSLATIYRTLKLLQDYGFAKSHNFRDGQALFEPSLDSHAHHDHLICVSCGLIVEFVNEEIETLQKSVARTHGFTVSSHKMELYGLCPNCSHSSTT
jgi:Fur family ferric uptake transcriptional regulator